MSDSRKVEGIQDFKRANKSKYKDVKPRMHQLRKQVFLTDTQTSDFTKSSGEMQMLKIQQLEQAVRDLEKQNDDLKQSLISMRANQFFQVNEEKLKNLLRENQKLKQQQVEIKKELQQSLIERDFLKRFNKNLKSECQSLTIQILNLKNQFSITEPKKDKLPIYHSSSEEVKKSYRRSTSSQVNIARRKNQQQLTQRKQKQCLIMGSNSTKSFIKNVQGSLNLDYFLGSFDVQRKNK